MGHNSLSKELLAGSQKGEYCSAYSKSPGPGVFCICPTVQVFSNLWVGDFCVCVFLLRFFLLLWRLFYHYFYSSPECWLHHHKPPGWNSLTQLSSISPTFFSPLAIHLLLPARPRAILKLSHATFLRSLVFFFYFSGERARASVAFSCPGKLAITSCVCL